GSSINSPSDEIHTPEARIFQGFAPISTSPLGRSRALSLVPPSPRLVGLKPQGAPPTVALSRSLGEANMAGTQAVRMRILLVGAGGTLGRAVAAELGTRHHIIGAGRGSGDIRLDLSDAASIRDGLA